MSGLDHPDQQPASPESRCKRQRVAPSTEPDDEVVVAAQHSNGPLGEMPLEILTEIFKHLEPASLLMLLRTSKLLRALLLNRPVASTIWKSVGPRSLPFRCVCRVAEHLWFLFVFLSRHCLRCTLLHLPAWMI